MSPSAIPAISDAELARLLGLGSTTPPLPDGLADRIMAALPVAVLPAPAPPRRRRPARWLRGGVVLVAGLGLASAVAAGLARTPLLAPALAPVMTRLADVTGLALLAPPRPAAVPPAASPVARTLPAPRPPTPAPALPPPVLVLPAPVATMPPAEAPLQPPGQRPARGRPDAVPAPARLRDARPAERQVPIDRPLPDRPLLDRPLLDRPLLDRPLLERPPLERSQLPDPNLTEGAAPAAAAAPLDADLPRQHAAEAAAELDALREARQAGTLSDDQSERLRSLQQLRQARAARPPRDAAARRRR
jgi:hypothetical protein